MSRNLFNDLYRQRNSPENFLTEGFAATLRSSPTFCRDWVAKSVGLTADQINTESGIEISTQRQFGPQDLAERPTVDLLVGFTTSAGNREVLLCEIKWTDLLGPEQLRKYANAVESSPIPAKFVFIGVEDQDIASASSMSCCTRAWTWQEIADLASLQINPDAHKSADLLAELHAFLSAQGLTRDAQLAGTGPLHDSQRLEAISALIHSVIDAPWSFLPDRYRGMPKRLDHKYHKSFGRTGFEFGIWKREPVVFLGFMTDGADVQVPLTNPSNGADLLLLVIGTARQRLPEAMLARRAQAFRSHFGTTSSWSVRTSLDLRKSNYQLCVQQNIAEIVGKTDAEIAEVGAAALFELKQWTSILFDGGEFIEEIEKKCRI